MPRHGENIFKRKDGRWEARFKDTEMCSGNVVYRSVYGKSYKEAKEKRARALDEKVGAATGNVEFFGDLLTKWLQCSQVHLKTQTWQKYNLCVEQHIRPELGRIPLAQISAADVNTFLYRKRTEGRLDGSGGLSQNYVRSMSIIINATLNYGVIEELCAPIKGRIYKPKCEKRNALVLTPTEQKHLESVVGETPFGCKLAIYLSLHTGLRLGEICALRWKDIDFQERFIHVAGTVIRLNSDGKMKLCISSPKTSASERSIPLTSAVQDVLLASRKENRSEFVVEGRKLGAFINPRTLEYQFHAILQRCALPSVPFHALRHTFATRCISKGMDMKSLSEILGHSNVGITLNTYVHPSDELKRSGMERADMI